MFHAVNRADNWRPTKAKRDETCRDLVVIKTRRMQNIVRPGIPASSSTFWPGHATTCPLTSRLRVFRWARTLDIFENGMVGDAADVELIVGLLVTKRGWNRPHVQAGKIGFAALRGPRSTSSNRGRNRRRDRWRRLVGRFALPRKREFSGAVSSSRVPTGRRATG